MKSTDFIKSYYPYHLGTDDNSIFSHLEKHKVIEFTNVKELIYSA
jgi:hypothetical protein